MWLALHSPVCELTALTIRHFTQSQKKRLLSLWLCTEQWSEATACFRDVGPADETEVCCVESAHELYTYTGSRQSSKPWVCARIFYNRWKQCKYANTHTFHISAFFNSTCFPKMETTLCFAQKLPSTFLFALEESAQIHTQSPLSPADKVILKVWWLQATFLFPTQQQQHCTNFFSPVALLWLSGSLLNSRGSSRLDEAFIQACITSRWSKSWFSLVMYMWHFFTWVNIVEIDQLKGWYRRQALVGLHIHMHIYDELFCSV